MPLDKNIQMKDYRFSASDHELKALTMELIDAEIGDSFAIPYPEENKHALHLRSRVCNFARYHGKKFSTRKQIEDGKAVLRFWKIA